MTATKASFSRMIDSTAEEWHLIYEAGRPFRSDNADRVIAHLKLLEGDDSGFAVDRLEHSLQTATRAYRAGEDEPYVVCALLHDIGDTLACFNHADVAAAIVKEFVTPDLHWMVEKHALFQGYYYFHHFGLDRHVRDKYCGHPGFEMTARFCEIYDQNSFDPAFDSMPLEAFEPLIRRFFAKPLNSPV